LRVFLYGRLAEAIGPELEIEAPPGSSVARVRERLAVQHPEIAVILDSKRARTCVGETLVDDAYVPRASDTLEFLPPVSGG
jgi:molybdopterin converting factor small subunit